MYEIDNKVPPPSPQELDLRSSGPAPKYHWNQLKVGESFFVPLEDVPVRMVFRRLREALAIARKRKTANAVPAGTEFVWSERTHKGKQGVRVWRTK